MVPGNAPKTEKQLTVLSGVEVSTRLLSTFRPFPFSNYALYPLVLQRLMRIYLNLSYLMCCNNLWKRFSYLTRDQTAPHLTSNLLSVT